MSELADDTLVLGVSRCAPVLCTPPEQRHLYRTEHGNQNPIVLYHWDCPVTSEHIVEHGEAEARERMLAHDCGGAGWCPTPFAHRAYVHPRFEVTVQDRERWQAQLEARRKRERAARRAK